MRHTFRAVLPMALATITTFGAAAAHAEKSRALGDYAVTPLVSDLGGAKTTDSNLKNPWGIAFPPGGPFWVNDNGTGLVTLYDGQGEPAGFGPFTIPPPSSEPGATAAPTGIVWNPSSAFKVPGTNTQAAFIFATEDGTIAAWANNAVPGNQPVLAVDNPNPSTGSVYKGLAFGVNADGPAVYATNFRLGRVDVFNPNYQLVQTEGGFQDKDIPAGFAPFGIENVNGDLFVSYAKQDAQAHDDVAGPGNGFVDIFDTDGHLLLHFARRGALNSPWGIVRASYNFGAASGLILIGNFGDGRINAFTTRGEFRGQLDGLDERPLAINGLWKLTLGGGAKSSPDTLYFAAGTNDEADGTFGTITPAR